MINTVNIVFSYIIYVKIFIICLYTIRSGDAIEEKHDSLTIKTDLFMAKKSWPQSSYSSLLTRQAGKFYRDKWVWAATNDLRDDAGMFGLNYHI